MHYKNRGGLLTHAWNYTQIVPITTCIVDLLDLLNFRCLLYKTKYNKIITCFNCICSKSFYLHFVLAICIYTHCVWTTFII